MTVFADPLARIFNDHDHSISEFHEIIIGSSQKQRLLIVCFTDRGETVRIFGARKATKLERQDYEENPSLINANANHGRDADRIPLRLCEGETEPVYVSREARCHRGHPRSGCRLGFLFFRCRQYVPSLSHRDVT